MIRTIDDLRRASPEEIEEAQSRVTVLDDLYSWIQWLNSADGGEIDVNFRVGRDHKRSRSLGLHPSALAKVDPCMLRLYWDVTGDVEPKPTVDVTSYMTFDIGTAAHSLLQAHFLHMYDGQFEDEVWLQDKKLLINSSHTDGKFSFPDLRFLLEIKTIKEGGNFGWEKVQDKPFPDNVRQVLTYMALSDCPFGLILYWCKNNSRMKEHVVTYSDEKWDELKSGTILPIIQAVENKKPPEPKAGYHCRWCDYQWGCDAGKGKKRGNTKNARRGRVGGARRRLGGVRRR